MLCLVTQTDSVIIEVEVESKAKGKQCLDKVCEVLGIIESDYMGLQYTGPHGEKLWLNLRNQIRRQLPGPPPYRLNLRVKFFVPPHLVLQEVTRYQFYLDIRKSFVENKLHTSSYQMYHMTALLAQIELGDLDPKISIATAVSYYTKFLPSHYLSADDPSKPRQLRVRWRSGGNSTDSNSNTPELSDLRDNQQISIETNHTALCHLCEDIMKEHVLLKGINTNAAIYQFLQVSSELEDFGLEQYFVKNRNGETWRIGVGPSGILVHDLNLVLQHSIPYASIHLASHAGRCFFLTFISASDESELLPLKLENCDSASALYRAVTEKHAFYSCETVRNVVTSQFIRDLKGTIASIFNENTALGKKYVFDIQRTCREVYDHTRRVLYQMENEHHLLLKDKNSKNVNPEDCHLVSCEIIRKQLATFQDSMLCRVCMDCEVGTVFFPCRHVASCRTCAPLCQNCPLCRSEITDIQQVYLPYVGSSTT